MTHVEQSEDSLSEKSPFQEVRDVTGLLKVKCVE